MSKIAEVTGVTIDTLLPMLDGNQLVTVNSPTTLTQQEENYIKKYRQLDADGKRIIDEQVDFQLFKQQQNAEKDEESLG